MKRGILTRTIPKLLLVVAIVISLILPLIPYQTTWAASTVGTTTHAGLTYENERGAYYANGLHWVFYSDGANFGYQTSSDGSVWSALSAIVTSANTTRGVNFATHYDGTYFYYAGGSDNFSVYYRRGTLDGGGAITWSAAEQLVLPANSTWSFTGGDGGTISADSGGNAYIGYFNKPAELPFVARNDNTDGTWATSAGYPKQLDANSIYRQVSLVSLGATKMYAVFYPNTDKVLGVSYNGTGWENSANISSFNAINAEGAAVAYNGITEILYKKSTTELQNISRSTAGVITEAVAVSSTDLVNINLSSWGNGDLRAFFQRGNNHLYYSRRVAGVWDASPTDWVNEAAVGGLAVWAPVSAPVRTNNVLGVMYLIGTGSPYTVRYAYLSAPTSTTNAATGVTMNKDGVTGGSLTGNVTLGSENSTMSAWFDYGLTVAYGNATTNVSSSANTSANIVGSIPAALTPGQTYHYRLGITNPQGSSSGSDQTFALTLPTATTAVATSTSMDGGTHATLNGHVTNMGVASNMYVAFEWGYTVAYGAVTTSQVVSGVSAVSTTLTGYDPLQTVHYRIRTQNGGVYTYGADQSFTIAGGGTEPGSQSVVAGYSLASILFPMGVIIFSLIYLVRLATTPQNDSAMVVLALVATIIIAGVAFLQSIAATLNALWGG